ncbi:hypothetical protein [Mesorhizobium sp.]|uniref:hypothetical protein n=1 Tax=Mesorhizobium sp. TaxID=1871066 RepID=UPI000FE310D7|nr:hypothetical protein [Mesorhizobium sp.]RWN52107.1 MAG: hypothetical protein EOR98_23400 [Mesorhizobium sp.]RWN73298.1 MAG: hypothetical protein EOS02_24815 [Mesorhizobium sp.]RWN75308.1 MAG: hypothetical protein EOS01_22460 [Mesorhizobium sp.]RWN84032.1 MAG: hypothetical protein EOS04_27025 [Mesorhizobium sp.]RWO10831.1 MAG: hypothetical protein EOS15_23835 [Mesorhizobium sp.]
MIDDTGREPRKFIACGFRYFGLIVQAIDRASKHPAFWKSVPPLRGRISAQRNVNGLIQPLSAMAGSLVTGATMISSVVVGYVCFQETAKLISTT